MIKFVNTTTKLPVGQSIRDKYDHVIRPEFSALVETTCDQSTLDIYFICESEFNLLNDSKSHIELDPLGVYFSHHHLAHQSKIFVCPELVLRACLSLKDPAKVALHDGQVFALW